jgi:hypothetical protein
MRRTEVIAAFVAALALGWLVTGCGDDNGGGPENAAPVITSLTALPAVVEPDGYSEIACSAVDPDGDSLSFSWAADHGTITGSGDSITWYAPATAGTYGVEVTVSDSRGGSVSDTALIEVSGGTLLVTTDDAILAVDMEGNHFVFYDISVRVEVLGTRIFIGPGNIGELDHSGTAIDLIIKPPEIPSAYGFAVLPDARFVYIDNDSDSLGFMDSEGNFIANVEMPETSPDQLQNVNGLVVGNKLIVSETGTNKLIEVDLSTYEASIFRDFTQLSGWLGDIDYSNGVYYLCQAEKVHTFTEQGEPSQLYDTQGERNIIGIAVVGRYAYITVSAVGRLYRIDVLTGESELFVEGLNRPDDIEFIPVNLTAP